MRNDALRHLYMGTVVSFGLRIVGTGIMFLALLLLARALPTAEFGLYIYLVDLVSLAAPVVSLGLIQICVRVVSDAMSSATVASIYAFRRAALGFSICSSLVFWLVLEIARQSGVLPAGMQGALVPLAAMLLFAIASLRLMQEMLRASRFIALSQIVEQVIWPMMLAALAAYALFGSVVLPVIYVVAIQSMLMMVAAIILFFVFNKIVMKKLLRTAEPQKSSQVPEWLTTGVPLAFAGGLSVIQYRGDIVVLGAFVSQSDLGPYAAAVRLAGLVIFALGATAATIEPLLRQYFMSEDTTNLQHTVDRSAVLSVLMALPVAGPLILFPAFFLSLFGPAFIAASPALQILAAGQFVNAITGPISPLIVALNLQRLNLVVMMIATGAMIIALVLVVPSYGAIGAASIVAVNVIGLNCALAFVIFMRSGIKTWVRPAGVAIVSQDFSAKLAIFKNRARHKLGSNDG